MTSSVVFGFVGRDVALAAVIAISPAVASATDLPPRLYTKAPAPGVVAPYTWSGFYVGGHLGYLWGRTSVEEDGVVTEHNARTDGVVGGAMAGYIWQAGPAVFGLEGDFGWTKAHGVGTTPPSPPPVLNPTTTHEPNTYDIKWTSHVRGRIGHAFDNLLFFIAGGVTAADLDFRPGAVSTTFVPASGGKYYGWSIGGGVEWALTRNLVGRVEYFYDDFGHKDYTGADGDPYRVSLTGQTLRGALAWKFGQYRLSP